MRKRYFIDLEPMDVDFRDAGPFRSYELAARGDTAEEMLDDAWVFEVDQEGETIGDYSIHDAPYEVWERATVMIKARIARERVA